MEYFFIISLQNTIYQDTAVYTHGSGVIEAKPGDTRSSLFEEILKRHKEDLAKKGKPVKGALCTYFYLEKEELDIKVPTDTQDQKKTQGENLTKTVDALNMKVMKGLKDCPSCNGVGVFHGSSAEWGCALEDTLCDDCEGTGSVPKEEKE